MYKVNESVQLFEQVYKKYERGGTGVKDYSFKDERKVICHATLANRMNHGETIAAVAKELNITEKLVHRKMRNNGFYYDEKNDKWYYIPVSC
ncbi:TPA: hypothetical protein QCX72_005703 [Bacillus wiedmannii]|nr:hypothetical protein [Bacillus wiedmannii]